MLRRWLWACAFVATVLVAALSHDAVVWAQGYGGVGFPRGGGPARGLLDALYCQLASPCVLTGNNASGTGTLRIRPSDEDTQLVLCEASNNAATEVCSSLQHMNSSATASSSILSTNGYYDSTGAFQRYWTSAGAASMRTAGSSTQGSNFTAWDVYSNNGTFSGQVSLIVSGNGTSTFYTGTGGTVTNDFRGPITNGGSATCNGINAGSVCINDSMLHIYNSTDTYLGIQTGNTSNSAVILFYDVGGNNFGQVGYGGATHADLDLQSKVYMMGVGRTLASFRSDDVSATTVFREDRDNTAATGAQLGGVYGDGSDFKTGVTPTALSGDVNDYAGCTLSWCRISGGAANRNITGLAGGADAKIFNVCNIGTTNTLVLVDESASSTAANRFALDANITIPVERCQRLVYDGTSSRWRAQQ